MKALKATIRGRVQGVWYRGWTVDSAVSLGLDGWVRNRLDGTVEALLVGQEDDVDEMLTRMKTGPDTAEVTDVTTTPAKGITPKGFVQKPTV